MRGLPLVVAVALAACSTVPTSGPAASPTTPPPTTLPAASPSPGSATGDPLTSIAARLESLTARGRFSGAVAIWNDDRLLFEAAYGLADRDRDVPNTVDTRFNVASIGKLFTAVAVAQLAEDGLLDLEAPVGRYVPDLPDAVTGLTIAQLLAHSSGLGNYFADPRYPELRPSLTSVAAYRPFVDSDAPSFEPGAGFEYSNTGYALLGMVIEAVAGQDFYEYLEDHVFQPAGMIDTGYDFGAQPDPRRAIGYEGSDGIFIDASARLPPRGSPAGGPYSTVHDLGRFAEALWDHRLIGPEMIARVVTPVTEAPGYAYGLGFAIREGPAGEPPTVWHNGSAAGIGAQLDMNPELGYTVVVLANLEYDVVAPAIDAILNELGVP